MVVEMCRRLPEGVSYETVGPFNRPVTQWRKPAGEYLAWLRRLEAFYGQKPRAMSPPPPPPVFRPRMTTGIQTSNVLPGIDIFFTPYLFSWFTLRKGYGVVARVFAFGWLGLILAYWSRAAVKVATEKPGRFALAPTPSAVATPS